jgi:hypothetical protein
MMMILFKLPASGAFLLSRRQLIVLRLQGKPHPGMAPMHELHGPGS